MSRPVRRPSAPTRTRWSNTRISLVVVAVFMLVVAVILGVSRFGPAASDPVAAGAAAATDSRTLNDVPDASVEFVEFLDFECEACRAVYPTVEELRERYGDRVSFVIRYFPGPGHFNAERAARAVEAAARQDQLVPMYDLMFQTQEQWGEQQVAMDDRFRGYAEQIGLDMARFDADYADPTTLDRVLADRDAGLALGVRGTPTFFVDGQRLTPRTVADLEQALVDALDGH